MHAYTYLSFGASQLFRLKTIFTLNHTHTFNTFSSKQLNESIQTAAKENNQWKQQQKRKLGIQFSQHTQSLNVNLLNSESLCIWLLSHITNECYIFIVNKFILLLSVRIELCQWIILHFRQNITNSRGCGSTRVFIVFFLVLVCAFDIVRSHFSPLVWSVKQLNGRFRITFFPSEIQKQQPTFQTLTQRNETRQRNIRTVLWLFRWLNTRWR